MEKAGNKVKVKVGSVPHPMEKKHYIEWIEIIADGRTFRKFLKPGDKPEAEFEIAAEKIEAREYCNIHGLWKTK
jgi:superoxide reductase